MPEQPEPSQLDTSEPSPQEVLQLLKDELAAIQRGEEPTVPPEELAALATAILFSERDPQP